MSLSGKLAKHTKICDQFDNPLQVEILSEPLISDGSMYVTCRLITPKHETNINASRMFNIENLILIG